MVDIWINSQRSESYSDCGCCWNCLFVYYSLGNCNKSYKNGSCTSPGTGGLQKEGYGHSHVNIFFEIIRSVSFNIFYFTESRRKFGLNLLHHQKMIHGKRCVHRQLQNWMLPREYLQVQWKIGKDTYAKWNSSYKTMSGSSQYRFGVLAKIVKHMRTRHQDGDDHPLTLEEILDETNQLDIGNSVKNVRRNLRTWVLVLRF